MKLRPANARKLERRRHPRFPLQVGVRCSPIRDGKLAQTLESMSRDLGAGGLALNSQVRLSAGETLIVSFHLPRKHTPEARNSPLTHVRHGKPMQVVIRSRVVWCEARQAEGYCFGVEFLIRDHHCHKPVKTFLEHCHRQEVGHLPA